MPSAKFTKRDLNRFRKVYPFIRRTPRNTLHASIPGVIVEIADVAFTATNSVEYTFKELFPSAPVVTVTGKDTSASPDIVDAILTDLTSTTVTIQVSADPWTGTIQLQAIYIPS